MDNNNIKLIKYLETKDEITLKQFSEIEGKQQLKIFVENKHSKETKVLTYS